jgi:dTMP kinase
MFITFEGIDGCGKSTQVRKLQERLTAHFRADNLRTENLRNANQPQEIVLVRDPGHTTISESIRAILLDKAHNSMTFRTELLLYSAARAQLVDTCIRPALERGAVVLSDRYTDSTIAYQGFGRGINIDDISAANRVATGGLVPDCTFFLHLTLDEAKNRCSEKDADRIESAGDDFFERVIAGYKHLSETEPHRVKLVSAKQSVAALHEEIWAICAPILDARAAMAMPV